MVLSLVRDKLNKKQISKMIKSKEKASAGQKTDSSGEAKHKNIG